MLSSTGIHFLTTLKRKIETDFIFNPQVSKWISSSNKGTCQYCYQKKKKKDKVGNDPDHSNNSN